MVGVPIQDEGIKGSVLSTDSSSETNGWFSLHGEDNLERSLGPCSLNRKINEYLASQGHSRTEFPHIYLLAAPRFLGHQFNPASFWYLYDAHRVLRAVLVEVNNTFGERRLYLAKGEASAEATADVCLDNDADRWKTVPKLSSHWQKDFHVSPFNSRKGGYSLQSTDPFRRGRSSAGAIDNRITLLSSHGRPKIVARVCSVGDPIDPWALSRWQAARLALVWSWVGFATFPRIVFEAARLYFQHKLHVWYRPELERIFRLYIAEAVKMAPSNWHIKYSIPFPTPYGSLRETTLLPPGAQGSGVPTKTLSLHITSPAFFSRMVYYYSFGDALLHEGVRCRDENKTVEVSESVNSWIDMFVKPEQASLNDFTWQWRILAALRTSPPLMTYPEPEQMPDGDTTTQLIKQKPASQIDNFVYRHLTPADKAVYLRTVMVMFFMQRLSVHVKTILILGLTTALCIGLLRVAVAV